MNICQTTICVLLLIAPASAAERPSDFSVLLADVPADALSVIYTRQPADLLNHPAALWLLEKEAAPSVGEAFRALVRLLDGPTAVVVTGTPLRPDLLAVTITAKVSKERDAFFQALDQELVAALNRIETFPGSGAIGFERTGATAVVRVPGAIPVHLTFALRDGYMRASSDRALVDEWLSPAPATSDEKPKTFPDSDDFKRLLPDATAPPDLLLYVNCRTLMPLARIALRHAPEWFDRLGLGQLEAAGLTAAWSGKRTTADLTVCLTGEPEGVIQLLQSTGCPVHVARVFPSDTICVLGGSFENVAALIERINGFLRLVDPDIVAEYEQEQVEFLRDFGFDIHSDFMGNFVEEWGVAVRSTAAGLPEFMLAVRLGNAGVFDNHLGALAGAFDLKFDVTTYREVTIFSPLSVRLNFAYGVVDHYLVIGRDAAAVRQMVDAWHDRKSLEQTPSYRAAAKRFAHGPSAFGYVNASQLMQLALQNEELEVDPELGVDEEMVQALEHLASGNAAVGLTLDSAPGSVRMSLEFVGGHEAAAAAGRAACTSVIVSLARGRELGKRAVSAANLSGIVKASLVYAHEHKGEWPASLFVLAEHAGISLELLGNVYEGTAPRTLADADRESYYLYRKNVPKDIASTEVVAGEREIRRGEGANFAFADGHVEFIREPEASRLLSTLHAQSR